MNDWQIRTNTISKSKSVLISIVRTDCNANINNHYYFIDFDGFVVRAVVRARPHEMAIITTGSKVIISVQHGLISALNWSP